MDNRQKVILKGPLVTKCLIKLKAQITRFINPDTSVKLTCTRKDFMFMEQTMINLKKRQQSVVTFLDTQKESQYLVTFMHAYHVLVVIIYNSQGKHYNLKYTI